MNSKHRKTLEAIFAKPIPRNIHWNDIEKLFEGLGAEIINKGGSVVTIKMDGKPMTFHRPHPQKEAKVYCVKEVRSFLIENGIHL